MPSIEGEKALFSVARRDLSTGKDPLKTTTGVLDLEPYEAG